MAVENNNWKLEKTSWRSDKSPPKHVIWQRRFTIKVMPALRHSLSRFRSRGMLSCTGYLIQVALFYSDIFAASFKMAAFYGFYTWVLLTLFGVYVKFIPSVMAALLAVCPLVPPYVMCIPAVCELWFLRGEYVPAIFLCIAACSPSMFVDIAIYGDVKT